MRSIGGVVVVVVVVVLKRVGDLVEQAAKKPDELCFAQARDSLDNDRQACRPALRDGEAFLHQVVGEFKGGVRILARNVTIPSKGQPELL
jgi:hypothetical protein